MDKLYIGLSERSPADYERVVAVERTADPDYDESAESLRSADAALTEEGWAVSRAVASGRHPVGHAAARQFHTAVNGTTFATRVVVVPERRRRRIGTMLHELAVQNLPTPDPTLFSYVPGSPGSMDFAEDLGYREEGRMVQSTVDPRTAPDTTIPEGIRVESLSRLVETTPNWFERLYELFTTAAEDAPFPIDEKPTSPDAYRARVIDSPTADMDAIIVAVDGDEWAGFTTLRPSEADPSHWSQMLTGVRRSHRKAGLGTTLKTAGLRVVAAKGATSVGTLNHEANAAIRAINARLGFEPRKIVHLMVRRPAD